MDPSADYIGQDSVDGSVSIPSKMASNAWDSYDTVFLNAKAGMDGVDKKKVQKVVYDMSKGSRYFNNEQRKEADVLHRIQAMNARAESLTAAQLSVHEKATDLKLIELEATRDLSRSWVHVDMDAFYAAVETLENPSLAGKPMAVGGMSMICTANYEARKFGVRAAMPGFIARKLCPELIFARPDFKKYTHYSELSRTVFEQYDPNFVARSLDEAYLDITKVCQSRELSAAEVADELRTKIHSVTGLTCSAGVGPNRLLAKVCSDINKPNGQYVLPNERGAVMAFVSSLPIRKVCGIGKVTERLLTDVLGVRTCADLLNKRSMISALFSQISTDFFLAIGLGIGGSDTPEKEHRKSLSNERTFKAISDERQLFKKLEELVGLLADDMQKEDLQGKTLTLKLKETGFEVRSRAVTLSSFICTKAQIWEHAYKLLKGELPLSLRLMGLRMSNFKDEKPEFTDPLQRTLTSFIHSGRPRTSQGGQVSDEISNNLLTVSDNAHSTDSESPVVNTPWSSGKDSCGKTAQESSHDYKEVPPGSESHETMILQLMSSNRSPQNEFATNQQISTTCIPIFSQSPQTFSTAVFGNAEAVPNRTSESMSTRVGPITRTQVDQCTVVTARPMVPLQTDSSSLGFGIEQSLQLEEKNCQKSLADMQKFCCTSAQSGCQVSFHTDMDEIAETMKRKVDPEEKSNISFMKKDIGLSPETFTPRIPVGLELDAVNSGLLSAPLVRLESAEENCESNQLGSGSCQDKFWLNDSQCARCGIEVNNCLPGARQEHEDYHFAILLQQEVGESGFERLATLPPIKKETRLSERELGKRKAQKGKGQHIPHKKGSHLPIETFFGKSK